MQNFRKRFQFDYFQISIWGERCNFLSIFLSTQQERSYGKLYMTARGHFSILGQNRQLKQQNGIRYFRY